MFADKRFRRRALPTQRREENIRHRELSPGPASESRRRRQEQPRQRARGDVPRDQDARGRGASRDIPHHERTSRSRSPARRGSQLYDDFFSPEPPPIGPVQRLRRVQPTRRGQHGGRARARRSRGAVSRSCSPRRPPRRDLDGDDLAIACPIDNCNMLVYPSPAADGTEEFWCIVNRHGLVATKIDGHVELLARTLLAPKHVVVPLRVYCAVPLCKQYVNTACGRKYCRTHCVPHRTKCGEHKHDKLRGQHGAASASEAELVLHQSHPAASIAPSVSSARSPSRAAPVPAQVTVRIHFKDRDFTVEAAAMATEGFFCLDDQTSKVKDALHLHEVDRDSLEVFEGGFWISDDASTRIAVSDGLVRFRTKTIRHGNAFPLLYYADMADRIFKFQTLVTGEAGNAMSAADAFECLFEFPPLPHDLDTLKLCQSFITSSPKNLRDQFSTAGNTPRGTWSAFVHACLLGQRMGDESIAVVESDNDEDMYEGSPIRQYVDRHRRPAPWQGPPPSEASSSRNQL